MSISSAPVRTAVGSSNTGTFATATFATATTAGNCLVAEILHQGGAITGVTDSAGNTWRVAVVDPTASSTVNVDTMDAGATSQRRVAVWYALNAAPVTTVTVTTAAAVIRVFVDEWSGIGGYRAGGVATSGTSSPPAAAAAGVKTGDLVVGCLGYVEQTAGTRQDTLATAGFVEQTGVDAPTTTRMSRAYSVRTVDGATGPAWTMAPTASTGAATAAFFPTASTGTGTGPTGPTGGASASARTLFGTVPEGGSVTKANSGSTLSDVLGSGGTGVALAAAAIVGTRGVRINGTAVSWWVRYVLATSTPSVSAQLYFRVDSDQTSVTAATDILALFNGTAVAAAIRLMPDRTLQVVTSGSTAPANINGGAALPDGPYVISLRATTGTGTTDGRVLATLRRVTDDQVVTDYDSGATRNTGTATFTEVRIGKTASAGNVVDLDIDGPAYLTNSVAEIARLQSAVVNTPPTLVAPPVEAEPWRPFAITATATDPDGIDSYSVTQTSGPTVASTGAENSRSVAAAPVAADGVTLKFAWTATDAGTPPATCDPVTQTVTVLSPTRYHLLDGKTWKPYRTKRLTAAPTGGNTTPAATAPGAPAAPAVTAGNGQVSVSWSAPSANGGSAITGYDIQNVTTGAFTSVGTVLTATITGLINGVPYTFRVRAKNTVGASAYSAASSSATPTAPATPTPPATSSRRLSRSTSTGAIMKNGAVFRATGANIYQLAVNDYPAPRLMTHTEIDSLLDKAVALGHGVVRAHTLGIGIGDQPYHLVAGVSGTTTPVITYRAAVWEVIEYAVKAAGDRGLYLQVPMTDELGYYHGGKRQWVNFRRPGTCSTDGNVKSANSPAERTAENYFYTAAQIVLDFRTYISDWLNHVNPLNGLAFKDDPTIAIIETGNELWTADDFRTWGPNTAGHIKSIAPDVLVADGMAADGSDYWNTNGTTDSIEHIVTTEALASPNIDIVGIHPYSFFTPTDVTTAAARAKAAGKAFAVGEYPWSKSAAPDVEQAALAASNCFTVAYWSLQNDADQHNNGAAYGTDDVSFYYPGKDSTQQAAVARIKALSAAFTGGTTGGSSSGPSANLLKRASTAGMTTTDPTTFTLAGAAGTLAMDAGSTPKSLLVTIGGTGFWYVYPTSVTADAAPVSAGSAYTGVATVTPSVTGLLRAEISWYNAAGSYLSGSTGPTVTVQANTPTQLVARVTAPTGAAFALVQVVAGQNYASGNTFRIGQLGVMAGTNPTWSPPGSSSGSSSSTYDTATYDTATYA